MQQFYFIYSMEEDENYIFGAEDWAIHLEDDRLAPMVELLSGRPLLDARRRLREIRDIQPRGPIP